MRFMLAARGWNRQSAAILLAATLGAYLLGHVSIELRSGTEYSLSVEVLDRLVLLGLAIPVAVLVRQLEDRAAWMFETGARRKYQDRAAYLALVIGCSLAGGACMAWAYSGSGFASLVFADAVLLLGLGIVGAVLMGAQLAWIAPVAVALVCSTPGFIPIEANMLMRIDRSGTVMLAAWALLVVAGCLFIAFDDYELSKDRLLSRQPGVTDE